MYNVLQSLRRPFWMSYKPPTVEDINSIKGMDIQNGLCVCSRRSNQIDYKWYARDKPDDDDDCYLMLQDTYDIELVKWQFAIFNVNTRTIKKTNIYVFASQDEYYKKFIKFPADFECFKDTDSSFGIIAVNGANLFVNIEFKVRYYKTALAIYNKYRGIAAETRDYRDGMIITFLSYQDLTEDEKANLDDDTYNDLKRVADNHVFKVLND